MREHDMSQQIKEIRSTTGSPNRPLRGYSASARPASLATRRVSPPTKANANLIRATMIPAFMAGCLERDGDALTPKQRASVEKIVYAEVTFDEGGDVMDTTEIYEITLQQEVLNESARGHHGADLRARAEAKLKGNDELTIIYDDIEQQIAALVPRNSFGLSGQPNMPSMRYEGKLKGFQQFLSTQLAKAA